VQIHRNMPAWGWRTRRHIEAFMRQWQPDVINLQYQAAAYQMHGAINLLIGQLAKRCKTVVTFHDLRVPYLFPKAGPLRWQAILHMARSAQHVIVTNAEDEATLHKAGFRRVSVVPIGSNIAPAALPHFDPHAWKSSNGIDPMLRLIGYFGFMNESKGGETLLRALAQLRDLNVGLLLIGGQHGASDPTNIAYAKYLADLEVSLGLTPAPQTSEVYPRIFRTGFIDETRGRVIVGGQRGNFSSVRFARSKFAGDIFHCVQSRAEAERQQALFTTRESRGAPQVRA
jgi:glycosyltransferase involved in cell wall biosynthesis